MGDLKNREQFSTTLLNWHAEEIRKLSDTTQVPISRLIEEALNDFFTKRGIKNDRESTNG